MNRILDFIARHDVICTVAFAFLLILIAKVLSGAERFWKNRDIFSFKKG